MPQKLKTLHKLNPISKIFTHLTTSSIKSILYKVRRFLIKALMSRSKLKKGEIIMKKTLNAAARPFYDYDLKGLLAWVVVVIALIALTACGGGGGGVTGPVPVTPTVTCAGQTGPTVNSTSSCPALSPAPTVTTVGGVLTLSLPPGAQLASASTLTVNAGGTGVVSLAVSAAGVITPAALPCGGAGQLLCSTSYPVTGTLNFTNAPAVMVNTSVMTPASAPAPTSTYAAAQLANPPVATNTKYRISSSTNGGQVVNCNLASLPCFFPNIGNGTIKLIQTPVKMVGNPDPVEAARDIVFAFYREGNSGANAFCKKMLYADTGLPVFGLSQDSLSSFGCSTFNSFAIGTANGVITHDSMTSLPITDQCTEWYWNQTTLQWTARAVSAATCTALIALP